MASKSKATKVATFALAALVVLTLISLLQKGPDAIKRAGGTLAVGTGLAVLGGWLARFAMLRIGLVAFAPGVAIAVGAAVLVLSGAYAIAGAELGLPSVPGGGGGGGEPGDGECAKGYRYVDGAWQYVCI